MNRKEELNFLGKNRIPCVFITDFEGKKTEIFRPEELAQENVCIAFPGFETPPLKEEIQLIHLESSPVSFKEYSQAFNKVLFHLNRGDTYLINLTFSTPVELNTDLQQIYRQSRAKYKILYKDKWVCFSPETFIKIKENRIATFPMKGTIDANIPGAAELLKNNEKEKAEHFTIVDLLRNDLSMIAKNVHVERLMYLDEVQTMNGKILQMSSEIRGTLHENWQDNLGDMIAKLLPAGSVSGAPKKKTTEIIREAESHERGFYTGIAGYFDGESLHSCVLIRFIEKTADGFVYKSGGGITAMSDPIEEYNELQQKIYVPVY